MKPSQALLAAMCVLLLGAGTPRERLAEAEKAAAKSATRIRQLDAAAGKAADEAEKFRIRAATLATRVQNSEAVLAAAEARGRLVDQAIARQRQLLAARQGRIVNLLAALESMSRRPPALALVQPGSVRDTARVALLLDGILPVLRQRTADLRQTINILRALREQTVIARTQLASAQRRLDESRKLLAQMEDQRRRDARELATASMLESDRALALSVESKDLHQLIGKLDDQTQLSNRLASLPGPVLRPAHIPAAALPPPVDRLVIQTAATPPARGGGYVLPALGEVVTGFGELSHAGIRARGVTLDTRAKAQVVAPAEGRIAFAGPFREYGNIVIIEQKDRRTTLLAGLDRLDARVGERVVAGGPVGRMGNTNHSLTIEVRENGEPVNPLPLMTGN
jgi:septal ring factor EnvC (AmiA/AmiB activator)